MVPFLRPHTCHLMFQLPILLAFVTWVARCLWHQTGRVLSRADRHCHHEWMFLTCSWAWCILPGRSIGDQETQMRESYSCGTRCLMLLVSFISLLSVKNGVSDFCAIIPSWLAKVPGFDTEPRSFLYMMSLGFMYACGDSCHCVLNPGCCYYLQT